MLRTLLVENDEIDERAFVRFVKGEDLPYEYFIARTSNDAKRLLAEEHFDIVFLDFNLDDGNSFPILDLVPSTTPVIFITGSGSEEIAIEAIRRGASDYLIKDINRTYLKLIPIVVNRAIQATANEQERLLLSHAVRQSGESIYITDSCNHITFVNEAFKELFDYQDDHVIGRRDDQLFAEGTYPFVEEEVKHFDSEMVTSQKTSFPASITRSAIRTPSGNAVSFVNVVRDLTEYLDLINSLESFAHTVAHDLKGPVGNVLSASNFILSFIDDIDRDEMIETLTLLENQASRMTRIIDALLLLAKLRQKSEIEVSVVNMSEIVHDALKREKRLIEMANAEVKFDENMPDAIGYAPWLEEVWTNYISNAIKYGGQPLVIAIGATELNEDKIRYWIQDNGSGLTTAQQEKLFQPFTRLAGSTRVEGHGLGLSIVRRIIERMNGEIYLSSQVNEGSVFGFVLPRNSPQ